MYRLEPSLKDYSWGSRSFIQKLTGSQPGAPLAELWFGAHSQGSALISGTPLYTLIDSDSSTWLGSRQYLNSGKLSYLLKILAAEQPLSIQVHPNKAQAEAGFIRENQAGIPLDAPHRCYRDDNHKPELLMALTPFYMLCGFRDYDDIISSFHGLDLEESFLSFTSFAWNPGADTFLTLFKEICNCSKRQTAQLVGHLNARRIDPGNPELSRMAWILRLNQFFPNDNMVIAPLLMNLVELSPLQAVSVQAGTPHAYLEGAGVEIMASSDNVLRAGLTPKYVNIEELCQILEPTPMLPEVLNCSPGQNTLYEYPIAIEDYSISYFELSSQIYIPDTHTPRIVLALSGEFRVLDGNDSISLNPGQAVILPALERYIALDGKGTGVLVS